MSSGERFSGYPARFGYATSQTMDVTQMMGFELDAGNTKKRIIPSGSVDPAAIITPRQRPRFRLRTQDLATVLGVVSLQGGFCFDEASTFQLQERADCGTFLSGGTHIGKRTQKGFMFVESITAEQDSEDGAILNLGYVPLYVDQDPDKPIVETLTGHTLLATPAYVSNFFLGPFYHNSTEIPGLMSTTLNFNPTVQAAPSSPGAYDDIVSITMREPEFVYRFLKSDEFDAWKHGGHPVTSSFASYFQKADPSNAAAAGDARIAPATTQHVKISGTAGDFETRNISVDGVEDAVTEVVLRPTGTLSLSIASAIP